MGDLCLCKSEVLSLVTLPQSFWYPKPFLLSLASGFLCLEGGEWPVPQLAAYTDALQTHMGVGMRAVGFLSHSMALW